LIAPVKKPPLEQGWSYYFIGGNSGIVILDLIKRTREVLPRCAIPIMACFSKGDRLTRGTARIVQNLVPSGLLDLKWFNRSNHIMALDGQAEEIIQAIGEFFSHQADASKY
jgi:esterase/lipase